MFMTREIKVCFSLHRLFRRAQPLSPLLCQKAPEFPTLGAEAGREACATTASAETRARPNRTSRDRRSAKQAEHKSIHTASGIQARSSDLPQTSEQVAARATPKRSPGYRARLRVPILSN